MELPVRAEEERFTPPGRYGELESEIRRRVRGHAIPILLVYAFDARTRLGPYVFTDKCLIPGALSAVAAALHAAGMTNLRVVMPLWNPEIRPSEARIDGRPPEVLLVSAMQIHSAAAYRLIRDAWELGRDRPLIVAGGPKAIYQPWDFFGLSPDGREGADVVVTGEEFVLLELLDRILEFKRPADTMRGAFERARRAGALEGVAGLVYRPDDSAGPPQYLINTGIQRLVRNPDELPMPLDGLGSFEPPHGGRTLSPRPLPIGQLHRYAKVVTLLTTRGCKFRCPYCPIAAYNQSDYRHKSGLRVADEIAGIAGRTGINHFFGCDDNFFNHREVVEDIFGAMARGRVGGKPFRDSIELATEATEINVYRNRDLLPLTREAGVRALYFGIEDLTGELVNKGQNAERTEIVFRALLEHDIAPMPMMIHYDGQPLWSRRGLAGLLNQVKLLRRAGALTCQITLLMPMVGSRSYEDQFRGELVLSQVGGKPVEDYMCDGNHCICTRFKRPWRRQMNIFIGYAAFYNPLNLLRALFKSDSLRPARVFFQVMGMAGIAKSLWASRGDFVRMIVRPIARHTEPPQPKYPMVVPDEVDAELAHYGAAVHLPMPAVLSSAPRPGGVRAASAAIRRGSECRRRRSKAIG